jgi:hypothetical protein
MKPHDDFERPWLWTLIVAAVASALAVLLSLAGVR